MSALTPKESRAVGLALVARGFRIFPLPPAEKNPPLVKFTLEATSGREQIEAWCIQFPGCNWGVLCDDLVVPDVDPKNGGLGSLVALELEFDFPRTLEASTPSGGRHLYYRRPDGHPPVANSVSKIAPGIDIRGFHGFVVAAGSRTAKGRYLFKADVPIADAPQWLLDRIAAATITSQHKGAAVPDASPDIVERAVEWLRTRAGATQGDSGDDWTYKTACCVRDLGLSELQAFEVMLEHWNVKCSPAWDATGLKAKVVSAYKCATGQPGSRVAKAEDFEMEPAPRPNLRASDVALMLSLNQSPAAETDDAANTN